MSGTLYVVATPIGNLEDLTPRAARILGEVDFIAAEDTRVTLKLLNHLGLRTPLVSYHAHNQRQRGEEILARLAAGEHAALCTDAGVPAISDPGEALVREALDLGLHVAPVPGPCAAVTALSVSGQRTDRFVFEGFLPQNRRGRAERLESLGEEQRTLVFYEAPHKLRRTLEDLRAAFGGERPLTLCRELTKIYEEIDKTTVENAILKYEAQAPKGEFVLVLAGAAPKAEPPASLDQAAALALALMAQEGLAPSAAAKQAAAQTGLAKSAVYKKMQESKRDE